LPGLIRKAAVLNERIGQLATNDFPGASIRKIRELPRSENTRLEGQPADIDQFFSRPWPDSLHRIGQENTMPQSSHDRAAELHNQASHAHAVAAVSHGKADHRTAHELSKQAIELSREALKHSEQLDTPAAESATAETRKGEKVEAARIIRPGLPG
jgi:hypothetical protein